MKDKHTSILQAFSPLIASLTIGMFLFSSCSNISTGTDTGTGKSEAQGTQTATGSEKYMDKSGIEFTGNPAYDIGLLNEWWAKNGTPFPAPWEESTTDQSSSAARSAGFGDLVLNFSTWGAIKWAGGTLASGAAGALVGAGVSAVLNALGIVRSATSYLNEICERLDRMEGQLSEIQTILEETENEVERLLKDVKNAGELTRYQTVMQQRDKKYTELYKSVMECWNKINDVLLEAAVSSQYGKDTKAYNAKLDDELKSSDSHKMRKLRLEYIGQFIDRDSLLKADDAAGVSFKQTQAAQAFVDYFTRHSDEISAQLHKAVREWGEGELGAARVLSMCSYLTNTHGVDKDRFNMFQLYDKYAEASFVWEQEGYTFRQQLRDQDSMLIALAAPLAYWYYAITETLGTDSLNCIRLTSRVNDAIKLNTDYPVKKKDLPYYQKWGSKWHGQTFTGVIKENDYAKCMSDYWTINLYSIYTDGYPSKEQLPEVLRRVLNENFANFKGNASYFYSCNPPPAAATSSPCTAAENMAMPSEWYKEMFEAYKVNNRYKPLIKIFMDVGFISQYGNQIQTSASYRYETNEVLFVTSDSIYAKTITNSENEILERGTVFITSVIANSDVSLSRYNPQNQPIYEEWAVQYDCVIIKERKHGDTYYYDNKYRVPRKVIKSSHDYRKFYYPVKQ